MGDGIGSAGRVLRGPIDVLNDGDDGKLLDIRGSTTLTLPQSLPAGFSCALAQTEPGQVRLSAQSGATLRSTTDTLAGVGSPIGLFVPRNDDGVSADYAAGGELVAYNTTAPWTGQTAANSNYWASVIWVPELALFVAAALNGTANGIMTSPDGETWTARNPGQNSPWYGVAWSPELSLLVAVSSSGANRVTTSTDGITWTPIVSLVAAAKSWRGVTWAAGLGLFVAVASDGSDADVMTSGDGSTWISRETLGNLNSLTYWERITWSPELHRLVAVGDNGTENDIMWSDDAITWTTVATTEDDYFSDVAWSPELRLFAATSDSSSSGSIVATSPDGKEWTNRAFANAGQSWHGITWAKELGLFIVVGLSGASASVTSPDGITWTAHEAILSASWNSVAWSPALGLAVAVSAEGNVQTSTPL